MFNFSHSFGQSGIFFLIENIENTLAYNHFLLILEIYHLHAPMIGYIFKIKGQIIDTV